MLTNNIATKRKNTLSLCSAVSYTDICHRRGKKIILSAYGKTCCPARLTCASPYTTPRVGGHSDTGRWAFGGHYRAHRRGMKTGYMEKMVYLCTRFLEKHGKVL